MNNELQFTYVGELANNGRISVYVGNLFIGYIYQSYTSIMFDIGIQGNVKGGADTVNFCKMQIESIVTSILQKMTEEKPCQSFSIQSDRHFFLR
jgi:hypothetical protein